MIYRRKRRESNATNRFPSTISLFLFSYAMLHSFQAQWRDDRKKGNNQKSPTNGKQKSAGFTFSVICLYWNLNRFSLNDNLSVFHSFLFHCVVFNLWDTDVSMENFSGTLFALLLCPSYNHSYLVSLLGFWTQDFLYHEIVNRRNMNPKRLLLFKKHNWLYKS